MVGRLSLSYDGNVFERDMYSGKKVFIIAEMGEVKVTWLCVFII